MLVSLEMTTCASVFAALLVSPVDTCRRQARRLVGRISYIFPAKWTSNLGVQENWISLGVDF